MSASAAYVNSAPAKRGRGTALGSRVVEGTRAQRPSSKLHARTTARRAVPLRRYAALRGGG